VSAAWLWVKKYWELLVGGLLLLVGVFFGLRIKRQPTVVSGKGLEQQKIEDDTAKRAAAVLRDAEEKKSELQKAHTEDLQEVLDTQAVLEPSLAKDPDATNTFLKEVGRSVRGGSDGVPK